MEISIFDYSEYRNYLNALCGPKSKKSGMKAALARAAYTFNSYISKVLSHDAHLTLEQAEDISSYLGHSEKEKTFFFLLVQLGRSGTQNLKKHFAGQIEKIKQDRLLLSKELKSERRINAENEAQYYSSWIYSGVDVALMVPHLRNKEALSQYFNLPLTKISQVLDFLISVGLVELKSGQYHTTSQHIHLRHDSPNINKHHINWRIKTMERLEGQTPSEEDLHYSSAITISNKDFKKLKELVVEFLKSANKMIDPSPSESVGALCLDLYKL